MVSSSCEAKYRFTPTSLPRSLYASVFMNACVLWWCCAHADTSAARSRPRTFFLFITLDPINIHLIDGAERCMALTTEFMPSTASVSSHHILATSSRHDHTVVSSCPVRAHCSSCGLNKLRTLQVVRPKASSPSRRRSPAASMRCSHSASGGLSTNQSNRIGNVVASRNEAHLVIGSRL